MRAVRDEAGVVAIVMTLAVSTFLLGVAALAVDLGRAYLRENDLQSLADRLALAGAKGLPAIGTPEGAIDQLRTTLTAICANREQDEALCPVPPAQAWTDGNPGNGELTFFADSDTDGQVSPADAVTDLSTPSQALRVLLPPSTVEFGLAGALGFSSARIQKSATARIGTPLGSGLLPFALTPQDLTAGRFCISTEAAQVAGSASETGFSSTITPTGNVRLSLNTPFPQGLPPTGASGWFTLTPTNSWRLPWDAAFHLKTPEGTSRQLESRRIGWLSYRVQIPPGTAGSAAQIWATGRLSRSSFSTNVLDLSYAGTPPVTGPAPEAGPCENSGGLLELARQDSGDPATALEENIRSGPETPLLPSTELPVLSLTSGLGDALRRGLLESSGNQPGRLIGDTGNGTTSVNGYAVDATDLFASPHLLDPQYAGSSGQPLQALLEQGRPAEAANRGWITTAAVRSHRLAVVPVLDPEPLGDETGHRVTSFRYVWIDSPDPSRGLLWDNGRLTGFRGYVLDPGYLPAVVSGSATVGPFLGSDMPKEAVLVTDLGSSPR